MSLCNPVFLFEAADYELGLHYFGKACMVEFTNVVKAIEEFYPELDPQNVVEKLPPWDKLSSPNVLKAALE
ncbi:hypothetical protein V1523DRAFT_118915 [Lipomyces doorenjongii]